MPHLRVCFQGFFVIVVFVFSIHDLFSSDVRYEESPFTLYRAQAPKIKHYSLAKYAVIRSKTGWIVQQKFIFQIHKYSLYPLVLVFFLPLAVGSPDDYGL